MSRLCATGTDRLPWIAEAMSRQERPRQRSYKFSGLPDPHWNKRRGDGYNLSMRKCGRVYEKVERQGLPFHIQEKPTMAAAGFRWGDSDAGKVNNVRDNGYYWSASPNNENNGTNLNFNSNNWNCNNNNRTNGQCVRPVSALIRFSEFTQPERCPVIFVIILLFTDL